MRRLSLSTKLFAAALPLILAVGALLALTARSDLQEVQRAESGAELGAVWNPLIKSLTAIENEATLSEAIGTSPDADAAIAVGRRATDGAINELRASVSNLEAIEAAAQHITAGRSALSAARRNLDLASIAPDMQSEIDPFDAYQLAGRELVSVGQLLPAESDDSGLGRELLAVVKLAQAELEANGVLTAMSQRDTLGEAAIVRARASFDELQAVLAEFEAIAPDEWATQYRQSGFNVAVSGFRSDFDAVARQGNDGATQFDTNAFEQRIDESIAFQRSISQSIVDRASADASSARRAALVRTGIILIAVLLAALVALILTRSIARRVREVAKGANKVASDQLPALVEALRDPRGKTVLPDIEPVQTRGGDELTELAQAFNSMQETLVDVAHEQVEVLRRGVSDIFITMARRNRSLVDRQLSMLDEFEAEVDDATVLANYYQLDHLATRMRRNSESLLVLANAESKRRRVMATEIDDVVRASIGEVEDYRRIEIEALESLQVRGNVVADISHLLAELLDNATSFSPPDSVVRVGGRQSGDSYLLRIVDNGVGISTERRSELNELLRDPPMVGLSVEATLGMSVVSLLAHKHGIEVTLSAGNPGTTVDVVLPAALFGPIDVPMGGIVHPDDVPQAIEPPTPPPAEQLVEWTEADSAAALDQPTQPVAAEHAATPSSQRPVVPDHDAAPLANADWTKMSLDLSNIMDSTNGDAPDPIEPNPAPLPDRHTPEAPDTADAAEELEPTSWASPVLPPPASAPATSAPVLGEFDRPPAPPVTTNGTARRPVSPDTARPAPQPALLTSREDELTLPTRSPGRGPDGPDRLSEINADEASDSPTTTSEPAALQAALAAFDTGRNGGEAVLPTRAPNPHAADQNQYEEPAATTPSRLDPEALRERLRAFQSEFQTGHLNQQPTTNTDLREDRR